MRPEYGRLRFLHTGRTLRQCRPIRCTESPEPPLCQRKGNTSPPQSEWCTQPDVCRSSGSGRSSGSSRAGCSRVAAAGSQKAGSAHSAGDLHKITTRNCHAHFCSPPKYRKHHLERGFCTYPVVYNYDNKTTTKKKDANCRYLNKKRTNIALVFTRELMPLLK